ncbi:hydrolase [Streptomyces tateyamensis]|uniref:Hydrolase n=1 Tax=Streptomyces tateyamensis TaxID=565073 RepID=A0A2V4NW83_9ACTN|nr:HAD-IA family hydrolase [Streptomyces tateyamensis]PYC80907.1 hydrolase [Streptomyces tateyamensis]
MKGVMFDFSGTLLRIESTEQWLDGALAERGLVLADAERAELVRRLEWFGALPGGVAPSEVPAGLAELVDTRDLTPELHRAAYTGLTRAAGLPEGLTADQLYDRHMSTTAWAPYPDAEPTLRELRRRGIPVAVVSNIGWDLRPVFRAHGLDPLVDAYLLSYELGAQKPDPRIFRAGCEALGLAPQDVLMVGDHLAADGGATALGCTFHQVPHLPVAARPAALTPVLDLVGF